MDNDSVSYPVDKKDMFLVIFLSICAGIINEMISWFFIYRKDTFKKGFAEICSSYEAYVLSKVIPRTKAQLQGGDSPSKVLMDKLNKIKGNRTVATVITGLLLMGVMPAIMSLFEYSIVGKLPFKPLGFVALFTHNKNLGNDKSDLTATAVYTVLSMLSREYTKVFLGYASPMNPFKESVLSEEVKREKKNQK